ncbi:MAG: MFS transporter [Roseiflexaceae bacterium]|nr:MFS transporter [Roseiflexus sp.]MDW8148010.1 MFS transporter [Roseiflexaceae bacterium]MDW8213294.1 MFS transporter [Roseiflexaceae bacterium]
MNRALAVFVFFGIGYFLSNFFRAANAVISGDLMRDLGLSAADLGMMTSLFYAGFAAVQLPLGVALDRIGPRFAVPALMLMTVIGCLLFATAMALPQLAIGRTLIGIGMAGNLMGAVKAFSAWFPPQRVATFTSLMVGIGALGALVAATPLAWLNQQFGWRAVFLGSAAVTVLSAAGIVLGTHNAPPGVIWRATSDVSDAGFAQIFRNPHFWRIAPLNLTLLGTTLAIQTLWVGPYLFDALRLSPLDAGNLILILSAGVAAGYASCGALGDMFGARRVMTVSAIVFLAAQMPLLSPVPLPLTALAIVFFLFGFSGAFSLLTLAQVRELFPPYMGGRAVTAMNLFGFGGATALQWGMGVIISSFARNGSGRYPVEAYIAAFGAVFVLNVVALIWYLTPIPVRAKKMKAGGVKG